MSNILYYSALQTNTAQNINTFVKQLFVKLVGKNEIQFLGKKAKDQLSLFKS